MQEIAYSEKFICPSQFSVDQLRAAQNDGEMKSLFAETDLSKFTFIRVSDSVVSILANFDEKLYWKIATWEISPLGIIEFAQERYYQLQMVRRDLLGTICLAMKK